MARPTITQTSIVVSVYDDVLVWTEGIISGTNKDLIEKAKMYSHLGLPVDLSPDGPTVQASLDVLSAPEMALAALLGAAEGRGQVLQAPEEVLWLLPYPIDTDYYAKRGLLYKLPGSGEGDRGTVSNDVELEQPFEEENQ